MRVMLSMGLLEHTQSLYLVAPRLDIRSALALLFRNVTDCSKLKRIWFSADSKLDYEDHRLLSRWLARHPKLLVANIPKSSNEAIANKLSVSTQTSLTALKAFNPRSDDTQSRV